MAKGTEPVVRRVEQLKEGAEFLKVADQLVRQEKYEAALKEIAKAREANPGNLYALAYEDRVRSLLTAKLNASKTKSGIASRTGEERIKPALEQLSSLAVVQAQRSFEAQMQKEQEYQNLQKEAGERRRTEELRQAALRSKIQNILNRIIDYEARQEYVAALSEVERAYLLDPENDQVKRLEARIRQAQAEVHSRMEAERRKKEEEVGRFREKLRSKEQEKLDSELREKKLREEEARLRAQSEKIRHYLAECRDHLSAGKLDDALSALAFVVVIDPLNEEVLELDKRIRDRIESRRLEQIERERQREEQQVKRLEAIKVTITRHMDDAMRLAKEQNFEEALRIVTRAYLVDPLNKDLQECETTILAEQEVVLRKNEEQRQREEELRLQQEAEEIRGLEEEERKRLLDEEQREADLRQQEDKERIRQYLAHARQYMEDGQFENALGEIALAFVVDPFDEEVKAMEAEVHETRRTAKPAAPPVVLENDAEEQRQQEIRVHLDKATRFRSARQYNQALEEIARACALDPLNEEIRSLEEEVGKELEADRANAAQATVAIAPQVRDEPETPSPAPSDLPVTDNREVLLRHVVRAREFLSSSNPDDALTEVQKGLLVSPDDRELLRLKADIGTSVRRGESPRLGKDQVEGIQRHLERAKEMFISNEYEDALSEIALGLTIDPQNSELKTLEKQVWDAQGTPDQETDDAVTEKTRETEETIQSILRMAKEFQEKNEFAKALDEIAKAYVLDPTNKETRKAEIDIRQAELRVNKQEESSLKLVYPDQSTPRQMP